MAANATPDIEVDALIVGAGFGGCYLLKLLREAGLNVKIWEAGHTFGGVWCWNRYPGARVDCELPWYGYSDPAIWNTWQWQQRFPDYTEIRKYFQHVAKVWDLKKDVQLNTRVTGATFEKDHWIVKTKDGQSCRCKWFLCCTGTSFKPHTPDWKGKDLFKGPFNHSALWPEEGVDMHNKRVAVIGCGSSGVQIVQEAVKQASSVTQFIRTPNLAIPMRQREISADEIYMYKATMPHVFKALRTTRTGLPVVPSGRKVFDDSPEQREALWSEQWRRGGFNFGQGSYIDVLLDKKANRATYDFWRRQVMKRLKDPKKQELLCPEVPPYWMATKRPSLEQDYYEMCDRDHVEVTKSKILEIKENGIQSEDKFREFDVIAVATGFDAVTGGLRTMGIVGRDGLELQDKWKDGVYTNVGMMVHGFPNMYIVYGPQAPTSFTNGPPFIELQCEWIADTIAKQREEGLAIVEANKEEEQKWRDHNLALANRTLAVETDSWYMGANIPGKPREQMVYMGGIPMWHEACQEALKDWKGFDVQATA